MPLPLVALLAASLAPAAPVPVDKAAERQQLERLWKDLETYDPVVRTRAVFALLDHPRAVEFLADKMPPLDASADQLRAWLSDLNGDDEKVWKPAFDKLRYHDPRTGLPLKGQIEQVTSLDGRRRLLDLWNFSPGLFPAGTYQIDITTPRIGRGVTVVCLFKTNRGGEGVTSIGWQVARVDALEPTEWRQAAIAAHVLRRLDTKASRAVLDRLAGGHKDALPTRTAVGLLKATAAPVSSDAEFKKGWDGLLSGEPIQATGWALSLRDRPDDVKRLAEVLPAIEAAPDDVKGWLKALNDDDPKVWKPAFERLLYFRPLLAVPIQTQCELMTTDHGRAALFHLTRFAPGVPGKVDVREGSSLGVRDGRVELSSFAGGRVEVESTAVQTLGELTPIHWQRARLAVVVLERVKTDEAKAVLKQLADGHPDILPTKEAKAALERMK